MSGSGNGNVRKETGAERLLSLLMFLDGTFPGSVSTVRVSEDHMKVSISSVHEDMLELLYTKKLFTGVYIETQKEGDLWYEVHFHVDLDEVNCGLLQHLAVRRCWGLTQIEHWIAELKLFVQGYLLGKSFGGLDAV